MKIAVNLLYIIPGQNGGTETYSRNLLSALLKMDRTNTYIIFLNAQSNQSFKFDQSNVVVKVFPDFKNNKIKRIIWEQCLLPIYFFKLNLDIIFSPGYIAPLLLLSNSVVTIHDMLIKRYPETIPWQKYIYWRLFMPLTIRFAARLITVSEFSKKEIEHYYPAAGVKTKVTLEAVNRDVYCPLEPTTVQKNITTAGQPFILSVATLHPHKNITVLLRALYTLREKYGLEVPLCLVGNAGGSHDNILALVDSLNLQSQVSLTGFVDEQKLHLLYSTAQVFVLPSYYEGFGLPILEAMSCGCPVVCSTAASLPEVGGKAAEYFPPQDVDVLTEKIYSLFTDKTKRSLMIEEGFRNAERFSWEKTASATLEVFHSMS